MLKGGEMEYPNLKAMTEIELILLHSQVADSNDLTDKDFAQAIQKELKLRCITVTRGGNEVEGDK